MASYCCYLGMPSQNYGMLLLVLRHVETFLNAIDTAGGLPGQGFAAVKLTALGNPVLLERMSSAILTVRGLFQRFDMDKSGFIDMSEFLTAYQQIFPFSSAKEAGRTFSHFDQASLGKVDYVAWCQALSLRQMPGIAESIIQSYGHQPEMQGWLGDLSASCLTQNEYELVLAMRQRLETIVERAVSKSVKLMVDAEHSYFQPAIDHMTLRLMKKYNKQGNAVIFNTYQAYLRSTHMRLKVDMERAHREGYQFACKLVRGAYMNLERDRAAQQGYPSPVWDCLEETHACYEGCLRTVMEEVAAGRAEVLFGSHNEDSIQLAVQLMHDLNLKAGSSPVYFGQLLGMADHLTYTLGNHGYPAFKYVPYGLVHEVIPYLLRRAQENASMLKGARADMMLLQAELKRRALSELKRRALLIASKCQSVN
ncbi:hypothetical protein CEUSTIGMA_g10669.t1 [Chlamydomonas eustigma]|uniref:Proline dehydrogenase n=1 Tax=Chlamydomonas eustigma TaxID=1157962 RepID=A0A250XJN5_9CHLO|nr:hypothetical protein CEUSTIGMA_g10669.t1 [Chlamydomonas eustigma]|eukprot:GAX83243.1 hypothetical protein CEUSTIGMA_g10669.t1 [Chlamydomonas eustigma]